MLGEVLLERKPLLSYGSLIGLGSEIEGGDHVTQPLTLPKHVLCDVSDLVYYIGHHEHLTGIQRVQACVVGELLRWNEADISFIAFNCQKGCFEKLDADVLASVLHDLTLPLVNRVFVYDRDLAKVGCLPGSVEPPMHARPNGTCILLLGAAWVIEDYFRHINTLRLEMNASFACVIHDLIPIYARETCDQGTAQVFRHFLSMARLSTDLYLCVSENTRRDLLRYFGENGWDTPKTIVVRHATALAAIPQPKRPDWFTDTDAGFVLFVSTIEGRKNHDLIFNVWRRLAHEHPDAVPKLICIGRPGWRSEEFLLRYVATAGLGRRIEIHSDVADQELEFLYRECRFTVYPSLYEGWGLPISESLAYGKLCVCSDTSSMPEAGGDLAVYIDPRNVDTTYRTIETLILDATVVDAAEAKIRNEFVPRLWAEVAADYLKVLNGTREDVCSLPSVPNHFVFRSLKHQFDGLIGDALLEGVIDHLRSDLKTQALPIVAFENGHLARGPGDWKLLEDWGCWIGLGGASICFEASVEAEFCAYISYQVLHPFRDSRIRVISNGVTSFHLAAYNGSFGVLVISFRSRRGRNTITVSSNASPEQVNASRTIDGRGLMFGLKEIVCIEKADIEARLDLMQAISYT